MSVTRLLPSLSIALLVPCALQAQAPDNPGLEEVLIEAKRHFRPESSSAASKLDLPVVETPQAMTVLGSEFLEIADLNDTANVVAYTPGIENSGIGDGTEASLIARGFYIDRERSYRINGLSVYSEIDVDYFAMDKVEFVRGPASSLYGEADYGATVNRVLKAPTQTFGAVVGAQFGNDRYRRFEGDIHGPLNEAGTFSGRAVAAGQARDLFMDGTDAEHWMLAPSLRYTTDATEVLLQSYYSEITGSHSDGFALIRDDNGDWALPDVPRNRSYAADTNDIDSSNLFLFGRVARSFSDTLKATFSVGYSDIRMFNVSSYLCDCDDVEGDGIADLYHAFENKKQQNTSVDLSLEKSFTWAGREQRVLVSADTRRNTLFQPYGPGSYLRTVDFVNENGPFDVPVQDLNTGNFTDEYQRFSGLSLLGYFKPTERLATLLGLRYSKIKSSVHEFYFEDYNSAGSDRAWVPRLGLVFNIAGTHHLFASYSEGVIFNEAALDADRRPIHPEQGVQYEAGFKGELFDKRLFYSVSAFTIDRTNLADVVLEQPGEPAVYRNVGNQTHRGVDVEFQGEPIPGFNLFLSYAYLDVEVKESTVPEEVGNAPNGAPKNSLSLFATYEFLRGPLRSLTLGGGFVHRSEREVDQVGSFSLPSYSRFDARVSYDVNDHLALEFNAKNVFDEKVYTSVYEAPIFGVAYSDVRTISAGATYRF